MTFTGPIPVTNTGPSLSTSVNVISVTDTTFSGGITNSGSIDPGGITVVDGAVDGGISDTGFIAGGITIDSASQILAATGAIFIDAATFLGENANSGLLDAPVDGIFAGECGNLWRHSQ